MIVVLLEGLGLCLMFRSEAQMKAEVHHCFSGRKFDVNAERLKPGRCVQIELSAQYG